ncbi:MAG: DUF2760 domain-containing protein [Archangium sp.]|nr:DUF2760 domain-containing protein [Archangium sp.]MDP3576331.1 DUF2760 domain-containing protein [Archangium sp.]
MSFFARLKLALAILFGTTPDDEARKALGPPPAAPPPPAPPAPVIVKPTPEQQHAAALFMLGLFQREGRLLDFLQEDIASFTDAEVGAAARLVHEGCRKTLAQYVPITAVVKETEGATMEIPQGFDANRFRLTGNVAGAGPWKGSLKHHGWVATKVLLPDVPTTVDVKVIAPAEVELP